jgi:hypothetical protein
MRHTPPPRFLPGREATTTMLTLFITLYSNTEQSIQLAFCFAMSGYPTTGELHKQLVFG